MIKINLLKDKKFAKVEVPSVKATLKEIKVGYLLKLEGKE